MKVTKSIIAVLVGLFAGSAYANCTYHLTGNVQSLDISDCVNTDAGKKQAEWMKGKLVKSDCSPAMNRIGWSEGCK
ncbi:hypothetical protein DQC75_24640 [Salmonella enterica subsp. enterica]|nr:hypothetical protein [Salmonella enterica subsp. enterica serovar Newport]